MALGSNDDRGAIRPKDSPNQVRGPHPSPARNADVFTSASHYHGRTANFPSGSGRTVSPSTLAMPGGVTHRPWTGQHVARTAIFKLTLGAKPQNRFA